MNKDIILSVDRLRTSFEVGKETIEVLKGVSFDVYRGKTLGIVGESGCGKSVTVHSVLQLLPRNGSITGGQVTYQQSDGTKREITQYQANGKEMRSLRGREIGIIFQDPMASLNPVYTVANQIIENLRQHEPMSKKEARARAANMLKRLGIPEAERRLDDFPHQFSGGMKQRVMIAIAMICNPQILIADEPTTALDVTIQAQIMELMRELQDQSNTSIILITHNMGLIAEIADHVAVMYMGRIVEYGTVAQILEDARHPYTRALLASVPVPGMQREDRLFTIEGSTPSIGEVTTGCEFASRCQYVMPSCLQGDVLEWSPGGDHMVRCNLGEGKIQHEGV